MIDPFDQDPAAVHVARIADLKRQLHTALAERDAFKRRLTYRLMAVTPATSAPFIAHGYNVATDRDHFGYGNTEGEAIDALRAALGRCGFFLDGGA